MCNCPNGYECPECMFPKKPIPHKHAELIKAWADGAKIEYIAHDKWYDIGEACSWSTKYDYRIKPEPKPDRNYYGIAGLGIAGIPYVDHLRATNGSPNNNIKLTFDGETGKLKSVQLI